MNVYEHNYGTSFGFELEGDLTPSGIESKRIFIGAWTDAHSFRDFGLYPRSKPVISSPEVQVVTYEIPGRDGILDATESLTGDVHFYNRVGTFEFTQPGGRSLWDATYYKLKNRLHGRRKNIIIDEEKDGYYTGRLTVEEPEYDDKRGIAFFTIKADLEPYKRGFVSHPELWLWDPFDFEIGVIPEKSGAIINSALSGGDPVSVDVTVINDHILPVVPHIVVMDGYDPDDPDSVPLNIYARFTIDDVTYDKQLQDGDNYDNVPELILRQGETVVTIHGTGQASVRFDFVEGWL